MVESKNKEIATDKIIMLKKSKNILQDINK